MLFQILQVEEKISVLQFDDYTTKQSNGDLIQNDRSRDLTMMKAKTIRRGSSVVPLSLVFRIF